MASKSKKSEVDIHHEELVSGLLNQKKIIFESSEQPLYLYLDDNHWACNKRFTDLWATNLPRS